MLSGMEYQVHRKPCIPPCASSCYPSQSSSIVTWSLCKKVIQWHWTRIPQKPFPMALVIVSLTASLMIFTAKCPVTAPDTILGRERHFNGFQINLSISRLISMPCLSAPLLLMLDKAGVRWQHFATADATAYNNKQCAHSLWSGTTLLMSRKRQNTHNN
jgi:hypothetical protein